MYFGFNVKPEKIEEYKRLEPQKAKIFSARMGVEEGNIDKWVLNISIDLIGIKKPLDSIIYEKEEDVDNLIRDLKLGNSLKELRGKHLDTFVTPLCNKEVYAYVIGNKVVALSAYHKNPQKTSTSI